MSEARGFFLSLLATAPLLSCGEEPALAQLPLSVALDYVQRHPEYILANPEDEDIYIGGEMPHGADAELDRHLAGDWVARKLTEYGEADVEDRLSWARHSVEITRMTMISQREPGIYVLADDCVCEHGFSDSAFARLVRGFSNCDGMNHVLAMLLIKREPHTRLHSLGNSPRDTGHTMAAIPGRDAPIFVDAWADFGLMVLSESAAQGVPTWDEINTPEGPERDGLFDRALYESSRWMGETNLDYGLRTDQPPDTSIPSDLPPITDARSAYLRARVFDLYGLDSEALPLYEQAADMACIDPAAALCQLATIFVERSRAITDVVGFATEP
jgi:hypothetical protein